MLRKTGTILADISALLIAAHWLRAGFVPLAVVALVLPLLLFVRRFWATRVVQVLLLLAAAEWIHTILVIAARRQEHGEPWIRMTFILGAVTVITTVSALLLGVKSIKNNKVAT